MEMNDIEIIQSSPHPFNETEMVRYEVLRAIDQSQGPRHTRNKLACSLRIARREQSNFMALPNKFFGQKMNYAFGSTVEFRWATFGQGGNLSNTHR